MSDALSAAFSRDASLPPMPRDFESLLSELEAGEVEKLVLTQRNRVRAVVVSVERWSEWERALDRLSMPVGRIPGDTTAADQQYSPVGRGSLSRRNRTAPQGGVMR